MKIPNYITRAQVCEAIRALSLDPDVVMAVAVDADQVTVTMLAHDAGGNVIFDGDRLAVTTVGIPTDMRGPIK